MMLSILIATFIVAVAGICAEYPFKKKREDTIRRRIVFACSVATAMLAAIAGYLQWFDQEQDKKTNSERAVERAKYEARIETLQTETRDLVTGGKSYVWIVAAPYPFTTSDKKLFVLSAAQGGDDVPAFDVNVEFETTQQCDGFQTTNPGRVGSMDVRRAYFPAVSPNVPGYPIQAFLSPTCDEAFYVASIRTRNRYLSQQTILKNEEGNWKIFSRLVDVETGALVHAHPTLQEVEKQRWAAEYPSTEDIRTVRKWLRAGEVTTEDK